ncbi:MAG: hypothetical protein AMXMBFR47_43080 [Planctomycetota bacterium]
MKPEVCAIAGWAGSCVDANRWRQIEKLFHAALACPAVERASVLDRDCPADAEMRSEVRALLAAHDSTSSSFIESAPFEPPEFSSPDRLKHAPPIAPGQRIGRYTLGVVLGRGGTGIVYEARQDEPARTVALKVMRSLPYADELTPRLYRREGRALARLDHPGIATIYEAGSDHGYFYFAMERVAGAPLTTFAAERSLSVRQRLELFGRVCDAVHYAHQRGVIHRDLKPSNILVTAAGQPKVLDFGLARIVDPAADADRTQFTEPGAFQGTLAYASPEHVSAAENPGGGIDVRSDVYSLGVILYELLSERRPYEVGGLSLSRASHVICDQAPRLLGAVSPALRGDLETINAKALSKDPARRYSSVAALSEDVERFLGGQPILAHPPSTLYQVRKLVARHPALSSAVGVFVVLVAAFAISITILYEQSQENLRVAQAAKREADTAWRTARDEASRARLNAADAQRQAQTSEAVRDVMTEIVASLAPAQTLNQTVSVQEALAGAQQRILDSLDSEPLVKATLQYQLGRVQGSWGRLGQARPLFEAALEIQRKHLPAGHAETLNTLTDLALVRQNQGHEDDAEACIDEVLAALKQQAEPDRAATAAALVIKARILRQRSEFDPALQYFERALTVYRTFLRDDDARLLNIHHGIANVHLQTGALVEAQERLEYVVGRLTANKARNPDNSDVGEAMRDLGAVLRERGELARSEEVLRDAWGRMQRYLGADSPRTIAVLRQLVETLQAAGKFDEAERLMRETIAAVPDSPPDFRVEFAVLLMRAGRFDEAEPILLTCIKDAEADPFATPRVVARARNSLERCLARAPETGRTKATTAGGERVRSLTRKAGAAIDRFRYAEAEQLVDEALRLLEAEPEAQAELLADALVQKARVLRQRHDFSGALPLYKRALGLYQDTSGPRSLPAARVLARIGGMHVSAGNLDAAQPMLEEALAIMREAGEPEGAAATLAMRDLGKLLRACGKLDQSEAVLRQAMSIERRRYGEDDARRAYTVYYLASTLRSSGALEEADSLLRKCLFWLRRRSAADPRDVAHSILPGVLGDLGGILLDTGRAHEAEALLRERMEVLTHGGPAKEKVLAEARRELARCLIRIGSYAEAETVLFQNLGSPAAADANSSSPSRADAELMVQLYEAWGR